MNENYLKTKIKDVSETALAEAIREAADVSERESLKLARMYFRFNDDGSDETLEDVLQNLEVDAELEILRNSKKADS
jgi:hypothetical protein